MFGSFKRLASRNITKLHCQILEWIIKFNMRYSLNKVLVILVIVLLLSIGVLYFIERSSYGNISQRYGRRPPLPVVSINRAQPYGKIVLSRFLNGDDEYRRDAVKQIYSTVWKAETFFSDPDLLKLCRSMKSRDTRKIQNQLASYKKSLTDRSKIPYTNGIPFIFWSFFYGEDVVKTLLDDGFDTNVELSYDYNVNGNSIIKGSTLLYVSLMWSNYHIESRSFFKNYPRLLLEHGALATERGEESPLLLALRFRNPTVEKGGYLDLDTIKLLIQNGANVNFTSRNGKYTPVSTAAQKFDFIALEALLEHGATVDVSTFPGRETQRALCYYRDKIFRSPLYDAEIRRPYDDAFLRVVELLERQGVSFNEPAAIEDDWERENACSITRRLLQDIYSDAASATADASESEQSNGE